MTRLLPAELPSFWRRYHFRSGSIRRLKLRRQGRGELTLELLLAIQTSAQKPVRLMLRFVGVEEYRFAKRPGVAPGRIPEARCNYLADLFFLTLDAWTLEKGEQPKPYDFRASDAYVAARELWFAEVQKPNPAQTSGAEA